MDARIRTLPSRELACCKLFEGRCETPHPALVLLAL
jgi:hypothetical protein